MHGLKQRTVIGKNREQLKKNGEENFVIDKKLNGKEDIMKQKY